METHMMPHPTDPSPSLGYSSLHTFKFILQLHSLTLQNILSCMVISLRFLKHTKLGITEEKQTMSCNFSVKLYVSSKCFYLKSQRFGSWFYFCLQVETTFCSVEHPSWVSPILSVRWSPSVSFTGYARKMNNGEAMQICNTVSILIA